MSSLVKLSEKERNYVKTRVTSPLLALAQIVSDEGKKIVGTDCEGNFIRIHYSKCDSKTYYFTKDR